MEIGCLKGFSSMLSESRESFLGNPLLDKDGNKGSSTLRPLSNNKSMYTLSNTAGQTSESSFEIKLFKALPNLLFLALVKVTWKLKLGVKKRLLMVRF